MFIKKMFGAVVVAGSAFLSEQATAGAQVQPAPTNLAVSIGRSIERRMQEARIVGLGAAALWPLKGNPLPLVPFTMLSGLGFGLFNVANNRSMFLSAPKERSGAAGGMQGTARLLGQTAGAVTMTLLFTLTPTDAAPQIGLGIGAMLTFLAALVSALRVSPRRAR